MEQKKQAIEAILLYRSTAGIALGSIADALSDVAKRFGFAAGSAGASSSDALLFRNDTLELSISISSQALDPYRFRGASRPAAAVTPKSEIERRIDRHRAAVVLRARAIGEGTDPELAVALCDAMAKCLGQHTPAGLVFWTRSGQIVSGEEFRSSTGGHAPIRPRRVRRPALSETPIRMPRPALALAQSSIGFGPEDDDLPSPDRVASDIWASDRLAQACVEIPGPAKLDRRNMFAASLAFNLCAPASVAYLVKSMAMTLNLA